MSSQERDGGVQSVTTQNFMGRTFVTQDDIDNNSADYVLLLTGETMTKIISSEDGAVAPIFGDGASATLLGKDLGDNENKSIGDFEFGTDGSKSKYLYCDFGSLRKSNEPFQPVRSMHPMGYYLPPTIPAMFTVLMLKMESYTGFTIRKLICGDLHLSLMARFTLAMRTETLSFLHQTKI